MNKEEKQKMLNYIISDCLNQIKIHIKNTSIDRETVMARTQIVFNEMSKKIMNDILNHETTTGKELWKTEISKRDNGFLVDFSGGDVDTSKVFQQKENISEKEDNYEHYIEMFYDIMEYFGDFYSKHRTKNIVIKYQDTNMID